ncbi:hypothetical protein J1614_010559 [Plenodomus biglobosus]|nr:hypothetical protein J1614_010559 [Plenodomus biglobosus]
MGKEFYEHGNHLTTRAPFIRTVAIPTRPIKSSSSASPQEIRSSPAWELVTRSNHLKTSRLQESSDGTDDGQKTDTSLGSGTSELGGRGLGAGCGGLSTSGVGNGAVTSRWVRDVGRGSRRTLAVSRGSVVGVGRGSRWGIVGGLGGSWGRANSVCGGVLAVLVNNGGGGLDDVGLGAVGHGGWLGANGGKTSDDLGGVDRVLWGLGGSSLVAGGRAGGNGVTSGRGRSWVLGHGAGGHVDGSLISVALGVSIGSSGEAGDDSEGTHVEFWVEVGIKYVGIRYWRWKRVNSVITGVLMTVSEW